jgi:hypothetical protein
MKFEEVRDYLDSSGSDDDFRLPCQATEGICNFLYQHVEKRENTNVLETFCLLVQIAIYSRDNSVTERNEVEALYYSLVANSESSINEFYLLGEIILLLTRLTAEHGSNCLLGCRLNLPLTDNSAAYSIFDCVITDQNNYIEGSSGSSNYGNNGSSESKKNCNLEIVKKKVTVSIPTYSHLLAIQRFWSNVLFRIISSRAPTSVRLSTCLRSLATIFSYLHTMDTSTSTVTSLCTTVVCFMECHSASVSSLLHFRFSLDVLRWLSGLFVYISTDYCVIPIRHVTFKLCSRLHFTELFADLTVFY